MEAEQIARATDDVVVQAEAVLVDALFDEIVAGLRLDDSALERAASEPSSGCVAGVRRSYRTADPAAPGDGPIRSPPD